MNDLKQMTINQTVAYLFAAANKHRCRIAFDDWSDVYRQIEFSRERDDERFSSMPDPDNQGGGFEFIIFLVIAVVIYFCIEAGHNL